MPPLALVSLPDVTLRFEGGRSAVVSPVVVKSFPDMALLLEGGRSAVVSVVSLPSPPRVTLLFEAVTSTWDRDTVTQSDKTRVLTSLSKSTV